MKTFIETFFGFSNEEMLAGIPLFTLREKKREAFLKCLKYRLSEKRWPNGDEFRTEIVFPICLSDEEKELFQVILKFELEL